MPPLPATRGFIPPAEPNPPARPPALPSSVASVSPPKEATAPLQDQPQDDVLPAEPVPAAPKAALPLAQQALGSRRHRPPVARRASAGVRGATSRRRPRAWRKASRKRMRRSSRSGSKRRVSNCGAHQTIPSASTASSRRPVNTASICRSAQHDANPQRAIRLRRLWRRDRGTLSHPVLIALDSGKARRFRQTQGGKNCARS